MAAVFLNIGMTFDVMDASPVIVREEQMVPKTHEYLFSFLDADLDRLEVYAQTYLECLDGDREADQGALQRIFEELFALHPFFRTCPANAAALINHCFASYIVSRWPEDEDLQLAAMKKVYADRHLEGTDIAEWLDTAIRCENGRVFETLYQLQKQMREWVFIALDNSNAALAKLTGAQRNAMYCLLYGGQYTPMLETTVEKNMRLPHGLRQMSARLDFEDGFHDSILQGLEQMRKDPAVTPDHVMELIQAVAETTEDSECHTYLIAQLEDLLSYEIYGMTQADIRIKRCKNCGRYFIVDKGNVEYCDRIATGESKPCNEIGKVRTYEQKIAKGGSAMALYRKAYKTHFARIRTGAMTKEQFDIWKGEATVKRLFVESGDMSLDEYAVWLKK